MKYSFALLALAFAAPAIMAAPTSASNDKILEAIDAFAAKYGDKVQIVNSFLEQNPDVTNALKDALSKTDPALVKDALANFIEGNPELMAYMSEQGQSMDTDSNGSSGKGNDSGSGDGNGESRGDYGNGNGNGNGGSGGDYKQGGDIMPVMKPAYNPGPMDEGAPTDIPHPGYHGGYGGGYTPPTEPVIQDQGKGPQEPCPEGGDGGSSGSIDPTTTMPPETQDVGGSSTSSGAGSEETPCPTEQGQQGGPTDPPQPGYNEEDLDDEDCDEDELEEGTAAAETTDAAAGGSGNGTDGADAGSGNAAGSPQLNVIDPDSGAFTTSAPVMTGLALATAASLFFF